MNGTHPVPDLVLERYLLGELPREQMEALERRCAAEPALAARVEELRADNGRILAAHTPAEMAARIDARMRNASAPRSQPARPRAVRERAPWFRRPVFAVPAGLALACGLLLTVRPDGGETLPDTETPQAYETRLKGSEAGLAIFRKNRGITELLPPQSLAKPGDTLQVFYHSRKAVFGMVFSVDGSGAVTLHLPESAGQSAALQAGDMLPLPHAYRLDKAPKLERFFLVTSPAAFECESMLARARAFFALRHAVPDSLEGLDAGFRQYPYTLRKAGPTPRKAGTQNGAAQ